MQPNQTQADKYFQKLGITPPTSEAHGTTDDISEQLGKKMKHDWRQRGSVLFCIACPYEHATEPRFTDYLLQGTDDNGAPILKKLGL
jgi:chromosome segregation and condensation protein ScpB